MVVAAARWAPPAGNRLGGGSGSQGGGPGRIMASPSINFNQFLEKEKLKSIGSNFTDWFRHVRIFLNGGNLQYVLDALLGPPPPPAVSEDENNVYETRVTRYSQVQCAILCSLEAELQKRFEKHDPYELVNELKTIFQTHAVVESYEVSKHFFGSMMEEGISVSEHVLAMSGHAKKLSDLVFEGGGCGGAGQVDGEIAVPGQRRGKRWAQGVGDIKAMLTRFVARPEVV
ncbi:hypothetical protein QYE76_003173 [Lolium multiflorum]|uniref:Uncharacterized protein n=1 Tax=Lolium multiflorum TaxID=4521 RepID=A0AAD8RN75_LOLMU|nr:hypothetical protein QYE76_003173 [Lolium multiflorum]